MTNQIPLKANYTGNNVTSLGEFNSGDIISVEYGGTGANTLTGIVKANGTSAFTAAVAGTDYQDVITATGILKGNGSGEVISASAGTDYVSPGTATNFTAQQYFGNATLTDAATISWNAAAAQVATVTLGGNRTMGAPTNLVNGAFYALAVIQDATGSRTLSWNSVFKFPSASAPTLSTAAGAKDYFTFRSDGTNMYLQGSSLGVA